MWYIYCFYLRMQCMPELGRLVYIVRGQGHFFNYYLFTFLPTWLRTLMSVALLPATQQCLLGFFLSKTFQRNSIVKLVWIVLLDLGRPRGLDLYLVDRLRHTHTTLCRCLSQILSIKCIVVFCLLITFIVGVINWTLLIIIWVGLHTISDYSFLSHAATPLFDSKSNTTRLHWLIWK